MSDTPKEEQLDTKPVTNDPPIKPRNSKSVAVYLVILFAAAFLLLLMAYFMQQRSSNQVIDNLQDSVSQFQTVDELREELAKAETQISQLEDQLAEAEIHRDAAEAAVEKANTQAADAQRQLADHIYLLTWYAQLEEVLRVEDYEQAAKQYKTIMKTYGTDLNKFAVDLGMVTVEGAVTFDLESRMAEIEEQLKDFLTD